MQASLQNRKEIAENTIEMTFTLQEEIPPFLPGQYTKIKIPLIFTDGRGDTRKFSIVNSPLEKNHITIAFRMSESGYKQTLLNMQIGTTVEIQKIKGKLLLTTTQKPHIFIAGGIGITPFISQLRFLTTTGQDIPIILFYFNKTRATSAYFDELSLLAEQQNQLRVIFSMTRDPHWQQETSKISLSLLKKYHVQKDSIFYVVGKPAMVEETEALLQEWGVQADNVFFEKFDGYS